MTRSSIAVVVRGAGPGRRRAPGPGPVLPGPAAAASPGNIEGFTVTGKGSVVAKPNRLEIDLEVSAASELTADAIVKYRDTKKRLQEAFAALKLEQRHRRGAGPARRPEGAAVQPLLLRHASPTAGPRWRSSSPGSSSSSAPTSARWTRKPCSSSSPSCSTSPRTPAGRSAARTTSIPITTDRYNQLSNGLVRFILDDYDKLEEEAYGKAIADAEARAQPAREAEPRQARAGHGGPRGVVAGRSGDGHVRVARRRGERQHKRLESSRFQEIPVRVELLVRFDVAAAPAANGRAGDQ